VGLCNRSRIHFDVAQAKENRVVVQLHRTPVHGDRVHGYWVVPMNRDSYQVRKGPELSKDGGGCA
jgi:hypothetical protein